MKINSFTYADYCIASTERLLSVSRIADLRINRPDIDVLSSIREACQDNQEADENMARHFRPNDLGNKIKTVSQEHYQKYKDQV